MKKPAIALLLTSSLAAQVQGCLSGIRGSDFSFNSYPYAVVDSVWTPIGHASGICPTTGCQYAWRLDVEVWSPSAPGLPFEICVIGGGVSCFPTTLPQDPTKPYYTQTLNQAFSNYLGCGQSLTMTLSVNPLLGYVVIASVDLTCSGC